MLKDIDNESKLFFQCHKPFKGFEENIVVIDDIINLFKC